jgi:hypothetical protein
VEPGLLVTGEAAGSTYSFTGEGIGKAMETGMLAADALLAHRADDAGPRAVRGRPHRASSPSSTSTNAPTASTPTWLADLLIWRARRARACSSA